ncbi:MAG: anion permease [Cyanobacteria bacterium J06643_13]
MASKLFNRYLTSFQVVLPIAVFLLFWSLPTPGGVSIQAWHLLAIFLGTIASFITKPLPMGASALVALAIALVTNTLTIEQGLGGFSSTTSWLTFCSFLIAKAIVKTGLGTRIAYGFMAILGRNTLSLSYGLLATDLILSPVMPSGNARSGGIIFPLVKSLSGIYQSQPNDGTARRMGAYLSFVAFQGTQITTSMFLTAMVANPLMARLASSIGGVEIDWLSWSLAALVPGGICLILMPLVVYRCFPPEIDRTPGAAHVARQKLRSMGRLKSAEVSMTVTFCLLLCLWVFGDRLGNISSVTTALIGVALLLLTQVLSWSEILNEHKAWDILIWFSILLTMATHLNQFGFIPWVSQMMNSLVSEMSWQGGFLILCLAYFYSNYFFASKAVRASAMYPAFLGVAVVIGTPGVYAALSLAALTNLSGCLTHYGTAVAPMYFSAGYVDAATWCKLGFILSLVYLPVWLIGGGLWWQILGLG